MDPPALIVETEETGAFISLRPLGSLVQVTSSNDEKLQLHHTSATGNPYISFYQGASRRAYLGFFDSGAEIQFFNEESSGYRLRGVGNTNLMVDSDAATGSPRLSFNQLGTLRSYVEHLDGGDALIIESLYGRINIQAVEPILLYRPDSGDHICRLYHADADGDPYISWEQAGTRRAYAQYIDVSDSLIVANEYGPVEFWPGISGVEQVRMRVFNQGSSPEKGFVDLVNAQIVSQQQTQGDTDDSIDWDLGNIVVMNNNSTAGTRVLTSDNERTGAHYRIIVKAGSGAVSSYTWFASEGVRWIPGSAPTLSTTSGEWDVIDLYWEGNDFIGDYALGLT